MAVKDWIAEDIASIDMVVPSIFGFFATNLKRAVPIPTATGIIRPIFTIKNTVDEKEVIEIKKKIAYIETDVSILKTQYQRLLDRYKGEAMADARARKKEDDVDVQKIISEITANPNMSIQEIIMKNPKIIEKIMKNI